MVELRMEALARTQHGLVTYAQALELGLTENAIWHRVRKGHLVRVSRGVYRLPGAFETSRQRAIVAVLGAGTSSAVSHSSAAALLDLPGFDIEPLTLTVMRSGRRQISHVRIEQSLWLPAHHVRPVDGIACTTLARTLFDLCGDVHARRAERALDTALARRRTTAPELHQMLDELAEHGRAGTVLFRTLLEERTPDYVAPESELEARLIELARRFGLPEPERQVDLGDATGWIGRVDFLFRGARIVVEVDGAEFHDGLIDRRRDAKRDERLKAAGWFVLRFRWDDVVNRPAAVARSIRFRCELPAS